jgi:quercetin dioxygenase-like cupin family protein
MMPLTRRGSGWDLQVHRVSLPPHAAPWTFEPYPGEILVFVLEGVLQLTIDGEQFELQTGDSLHSDARQFHCLSCAGNRPCVVIWCNSPLVETTAPIEGGDNSPVIS